MNSVGGARGGVLDADEVQYNEQIAHWIASWGKGVNLQSFRFFLGGG